MKAISKEYGRKGEKRRGEGEAGLPENEISSGTRGMIDGFLW